MRGLVRLPLQAVLPPEFLHSLEVTERLDARLCLAGHGRTFTDVRAHITANRALAHERLGRVREAVASSALTAYEVVPRLYGEPLSPATGNWWLSETLCYLKHLEAVGDARRLEGEPERWTSP